MNAIVTYGPAYEPIDATRRITNASTGRLGALLADSLRSRGHRVISLRGTGATFRLRDDGERPIEFATNGDLEQELAALAAGGGIDAVFHAAALCDFGVAAIEDSVGQPVVAGKIPSRADGYRLLLRPLPKIVHRLRDLFPDAWIAGWKYETEGDRDRVIALGLRQIGESRTNLCVLNGPGFGPGFGLLEPDGSVKEADGIDGLINALAFHSGA